MNGDSYPEFHQGAAGYARYYWHTLADTADENFFCWRHRSSPLPPGQPLLYLGHGGFKKRTWYAVTRVLVTRTDMEIQRSTSPRSSAPALRQESAASTTPRTIAPGPRSVSGAHSDLIDCFNFFWKEYWPDVNKRVFHTQ